MQLQQIPQNSVKSLTRQIKFCEYSQTCVQQPPLGLKKSGCCLKVKAQFIPMKLLSVLENWGSSWPLQTGGRCLEVVVNTGLTVGWKLGLQTLRILLKGFENGPKNHFHRCTVVGNPGWGVLWAEFFEGGTWCCKKIQGVPFLCFIAFYDQFWGT